MPFAVAASLQNYIEFPWSQGLVPVPMPSPELAVSALTRYGVVVTKGLWGVNYLPNYAIRRQ